MVCVPGRAVTANTTTLRMKDSDIDGKKNIPSVKHPLINTNLFPWKAAGEGEDFLPTCQTAKQ